jgi:hypothetical protein
MKLVDVFRVLLPFEIQDKARSRDGKKEYIRTHLVVENLDRQKITKEDLEQFFVRFKERIKKKYGDEIAELFYLKERKYMGRIYLVFSRKNVKIADPRLRKRISLYFDLEKQRVYIPASYIKKAPRLVNFILLRTLGELGLVKKEYQG